MTWQTHEITNQFDELQNHQLFATDTPLREALARAGAASFEAQLDTYGTTLGQAETYALADQANRYTPELKSFDARGRRVGRRPGRRHTLAPFLKFSPHGVLAHRVARYMVRVVRPGRVFGFAAQQLIDHAFQTIHVHTSRRRQPKLRGDFHTIGLGLALISTRAPSIKCSTWIATAR